jgi:hypothetical protein
MRTLISAVEVLDHVPGDDNLNAKLFEKHIIKVEFKYLWDKETGCLGSDFYNALLANARTFVQYDSTVPVDTGVVVVYESNLWKSLIDANNTVPGTDPGVKWESVTKFANSDYQTLWDNYLCELLSYMVAEATVYKSSFRFTNMGVMRHEGDKSRAAELDGVRLLKDEFMSDIEILFKRMNQYLVSNKTTFPLYKTNQECKDDSCKSHGRMSVGVYVDTGSAGNNEYKLYE